MQNLAMFATRMRAESLVEDLAEAGIKAVITQAPWINKKLPPPKVAVSIDAKDSLAANAVLIAFNGGK